MAGKKCGWKPPSKNNPNVLPNIISYRYLPGWLAKKVYHNYLDPSLKRQVPGPSSTCPRRISRREDLEMGIFSSLGRFLCTLKFENHRGCIIVPRKNVSSQRKRAFWERGKAITWYQKEKEKLTKYLFEKAQRNLGIFGISRTKICIYKESLNQTPFRFFRNPNDFCNTWGRSEPKCICQKQRLQALPSPPTCIFREIQSRCSWESCPKFIKTSFFNNDVVAL